MGMFTGTLAGISPAEQARRYQQLATTALAHYALDTATAELLGHNSGITYRVTAAHPDRCFLLATISWKRGRSYGRCAI